jgi:hypothetical protein
MSAQIAWLPPLVLLSDFGGDWAAYEAAIYELFCNDFLRQKLAFRGTRVGLKRHPLSLGKEATYWHFISEGDVEAERTPDMRRCERIRWPRATIENCDAQGVKVWETTRNGQVRIMLWIEDADYVVVLSKREGYVLPWTAFYVEHPHRRKKLQRDFETAQSERRV